MRVLANASGGTPAVRYRLYFFDRSGHIRHALDLECEDDAQASREVEKHRTGAPMELWEAKRLVKRFPPSRV